MIQTHTHRRKNKKKETSVIRGKSRVVFDGRRGTSTRGNFAGFDNSLLDLLAILFFYFFQMDKMHLFLSEMKKPLPLPLIVGKSSGGTAATASSKHRGDGARPHDGRGIPGGWSYNNHFQCCGIQASLELVGPKFNQSKSTKRQHLSRSPSTTCNSRVPSGRM